MSDKLSDCAECGMPCTRGEYHPHAACLMFKGCHDSATVRAGLAAIREHALAASPAPALSISDVLAKPLTRCAAARDGDCSHAQCPQLRDNEPHATGRHCPIDNWGDDD